ncbi:MAG: hypothetical protein KC636_16965 [Myxococcales bacterium]|nr:hypothetical protein [Myxococcales bacterium]
MGRAALGLGLILGLGAAGCGDTDADVTSGTGEPTTAGPTSDPSGSTSDPSTTASPTSDPGTGSSGSTTATTTDSTTDPDTTDPSTTDPDTETGVETVEPNPTDTDTDPDTTDTDTTDTDTDTTDTDTTDTGVPDCQDILLNPAGPEVVMAPEFAEFYTTYDLGPVPGVPMGALLGGCTIHYADDNKLLIAGESETSTGKIYEIGVVRGECGNIIDWDGLATPLVDAPYVDANLAYGPKTVLFYTHWPVNQVSQLLPEAMAPVSNISMMTIGVNEDQGVSGLGFVPPSLDDPTGLRVLTWAGGHWYHVDYSEQADHFALTGTTKITSLPNGPGGFAYVPADSPGFDALSIIVSEWSSNTVGVYEVDALGDPQNATRKDFFTTFPRPWGAYFEPVKGDFLFLTWGAPNLDDRVYIVQGFEPPPPIPQ